MVIDAVVDLVAVDVVDGSRLISAFREAVLLLQLLSSATTRLEVYPRHGLFLPYNIRSPLTDGIMEPSFRVVDSCAPS